MDKGRSALFEFTLDTLELQKRYPVPVDGLPHVLGKMTLASTGDLYFADRSLPIIYSLKSGGDRLQPLYATRNLINLRGIAVSDDGQSLYFSDYELGVIRLDLSNGQVTTLGRPETLNVGVKNRVLGPATTSNSSTICSPASAKSPFWL